jgi:Tol biopolymer transport system component
MGGDYWGSQIYVVTVSDGTRKKVAKGSDPTWAPDGLRLAFVAPEASYWDFFEPGGRAPGSRPGSDPEKLIPQGKELSVADLLTGRVEKLTQIAVSNPRWNPEGEQIVFQFEEPIDWEERMKKGNRAADFGLSGMPDMSEMLERALESGGETNIQANQGLYREIDNMMGEGFDVPLDMLLNATDIYVVNSDGSELTKLTEGGNSASPRWTPEGDKILYTYYPPEKKHHGQIWTMDRQGSGKEPVLGESISVSDNRTVAMLPGGKGFLFEGWVKGNPGRFSLHTLSKGSDVFYLDSGSGEPKRMENKHEFKQNFSVSHDGKSFAYQVINEDGQYEIWRMKL